MKKLIAMLLIVMLVSCIIPGTQQETIENFANYYYDNIVILNKQVFPVIEPLTRSIVYYGDLTRDTEEDFDNGIMYYENSYSYDSLIHDLDLSGITGGEIALMCIEIEVIDHGYDYYKDQYDDSYGGFFVRAKDSSVKYYELYPVFNSYSVELLLLTDDYGFLEWYHECNQLYWDNPTCEPGYEIYKWEQITITVKWYCQTEG